jgi:ribosomal protein S18 acetylase RimI-like enzyme
MKIKIIAGSEGPDQQFTNEKIADFLFTHLEQYGDPKADILACLDYVFNPQRGGFIVVGYTENEDIMGAVIVNETGMSRYIPENILVYIAVDSQFRGQGVGKKLMQAALEKAKGDVALHVEPDNPAKFLYENLGFTSKYLEMRYKK